MPVTLCPSWTSMPLPAVDSIRTPEPGSVSMPSLIQREMHRRMRGTKPGTAARMTKLASVRWVLATDDAHFVAVDDQAAVSLTRDAGKAAVYDGRDNETLKLRFMEALLREPLQVVLLAESGLPKQPRGA